MSTRETHELSDLFNGHVHTLLRVVGRRRRRPLRRQWQKDIRATGPKCHLQRASVTQGGGPYCHCHPPPAELIRVGTLQGCVHFVPYVFLYFSNYLYLAASGSRPIKHEATNHRIKMDSTDRYRGPLYTLFPG